SEYETVGWERTERRRSGYVSTRKRKSTNQEPVFLIGSRRSPSLKPLPEARLFAAPTVETTVTAVMDCLWFSLSFRLCLSLAFVLAQMFPLNLSLWLNGIRFWLSIGFIDVNIGVDCSDAFSAWCSGCSAAIIIGLWLVLIRRITLLCDYLKDAAIKKVDNVSSNGRTEAIVFKDLHDFKIQRRGSEVRWPHCFH